MDCTNCKFREDRKAWEEPCSSCINGDGEMENWQGIDGFDYDRARSYLRMAQDASGVDGQLEANILVRLSKMVMEFNTGR